MPRRCGDVDRRGSGDGHGPGGGRGGATRRCATTATGRAGGAHAVIYQVYPRSFADANGDGIGDLAGVRSRLPLPREPRHRRDLVHPVVPLAARRRRLRRRRLPGDRSGVRDARGGRGADRRGGGARDPDDRRRRPQPRLRPAPLVPAPPWPPGRARPSATGSGSGPAAGPAATGCPTDWPNNFARHDLDPDDQPRRHARGVVPPPVLGRPAGPQLGPPGRPRRARGDPPVLVRPRGRPASGSTPRPCWSRTRRWRRCPADPAPGAHPIQDRDELHAIYRSWRAIADGYPGDRILVGEIWLPDVDRFARYLRPDELHTAFNFDYLARAWDAAELRASIDLTLAAHAPVAAAPTWVLENHDVTRLVTRYGRADTSFAFRDKRPGTPPTSRSAAAGPAPRRCSRPRCRARCTSTRARSWASTRSRTCRPSSSPTRCTSAPAAPTRAATGAGSRCPGRAPRRRSASAPTGAAAAPWLRQPADWAALTVEAQDADPASMLSLYRALLRIRRLDARPGAGGVRLARRRRPACSRSGAGRASSCVANLSPHPVDLPEGEVLLVSSPLEDGRLPTDTTAWLRTAPAPQEAGIEEEEELDDIGPDGASPTGRGPAGSVSEHE